VQLQCLQHHLAVLYELDTLPNVEDFLTTDRQLISELDGSRPSKEKLLVQELGDELGVSLFLDPDVLQRLRDDDPIDRLHDGNIDDFWLALEGVSHFVYLSWKAGRGRQVSLLEMELQAEVDKYIVAVGLFGEQRQGKIPRHLHYCLFELPTFAADLDDNELERYHHANRYAGKYCLHLQSHFLEADRRRGLLSELRRFYRLAQPDKIHRIENKLS
jgi:hypothetical protein